MTDFAEMLFTSSGFAVVCAIFLIGFISGFGLRWLTEFSDQRVLVVSGLLPIFLFAVLAFLASFGHGALGLTHYVNWHALVEFLVMFVVGCLGASLGLRAYQYLSRFLLRKRSEKSE